MTAANNQRPKGRPRKVPLRTDSPGELTSVQNSQIIQSRNAAIRYQKQKIEKEIAKRIDDGEDHNDVRKNMFALVKAMYLDAREDVPASIIELKVGDMTLSGEPVNLLAEEMQSRQNLPKGRELTFSEYLPSVAAHTQTIPTNLGYTSKRVSHGSRQVSTRLPKKNLSPKDFEKGDLMLKPKGSFGLTYDEQSNLITREKCGLFVGADTLLARTRGQRGRSRKSRLAIFKSARLSELSCFSEEGVIPLRDEDSKKAELMLKLKGSFGLTYDEQSKLIAREKCGLFVGADTLRARTPGQRGRIRKSRLAIFKSARVSELPWFSEEIVTPLRDEDSIPVCDESRPRPHALSPRLPGSTGALRKEAPPPVMEISTLFPAENGGADTSTLTHIGSSPDLQELSGNRSAGLGIEDQAYNSDLATFNESPVVPFIETDIHATVESPAQYEETSRTLLGLSPNISPFTPINQSHSKIPTEEADNEVTFNAQIDKMIPLKGTSKSQVSQTTAASAGEQRMSVSITPDIGILAAPLIIENSPRISAQREIHDVADGQTEIESATPAQVSPAFNAMPPVSDGTGTDAHGEAIQTDNRRTKPVTISGGSVAIVRKNMMMDIMHMCGGIYSGHKELSGPFTTAWARHNKPGTPDSKTIYTTFRSLVQSGKIRELKFSFQTPEGLMVTKSMITLASISPTNPRVAEMQKLIIACYPSSYIPEGVQISEEVPNLPVYSSKFGTNRTLADLEIDNESQVRLQHKPLYVTRLEERKTAAEKSRQIRQARLEAMREKPKKPIRRTKFSVSL